MFVIVRKREVKQGRLVGVLNTLLHWIKAVLLIVIFILPFTPILLAIWITLGNAIDSLWKKMRRKIWGEEELW